MIAARLFLLSITLCILVNSSIGNPHPELQKTELSKVDRLYLTCKVWGFLKYYHPLVGNGSFNWDEKLQAVLANTSDIQTNEEFSNYMTRWIYYMGPREKCRNCPRPDREGYFLKNFDLSWTQSSLFSGELKKTLKDIEINRFQGDHHYIGLGTVGQFEPKNEDPHYNLRWEEENQRLIPLFRFWNYVEYFFPYKYQTDQNWDEVLREMIPKFLGASTKIDFHLAMLELVVKIDDSHAGMTTTILEQMPYYAYPPVRIEMIENKAVVTEIIDKEKATLNNLELGDIILSVNGVPTLDLHNSHKNIIWGSNDAAKNRTLHNTLFMGVVNGAQVEIERSGMISNQELFIYKYADLNYEKNDNLEKWTIIDDSIGYVNMGILAKSDVDKMMEDLSDTQAIIFDIRNYPKGTLYKIAKYLNPEASPFSKFIIPDFQYPGTFKWSEPYSCGEENPDYYKGEVVLLVNEKTQSHAEFTCMCLQTAPNVITVGSQTSGADGNVTNFSLIQRAYTSFSGIGVFYPDGKETQRIGIVPDVYVTRSIEGVQKSRDVVLDKAVAVAKEEIAKKLAELELEKEQLLHIDSSLHAPIKIDSLNTEGGQDN